MSGLLRDLVHAWRGLRQSPVFLVAALATIGIGIGANVTVFSIVNGISLRPMPFGDHTDRLVTIHPTHRLETEEPAWGDCEISYRDLIDFRAAGSIEGLGGYMIRNFVLSGDASSAERLVGGSVTPELFRLLGVDPILGRHFLPEEAAAPGLETSVMLTHSLWQRRYAGDPSIIGKTIIINDGARTVVGVLPPRFQFPVRDQLYMPLRWDESSRSARNINAVALMRPGRASNRRGPKSRRLRSAWKGRIPTLIAVTACRSCRSATRMSALKRTGFSSSSCRQLDSSC